MKKVLIFGTFDGIHEGHRAFLREARSHGDYLVAVVAPDEAVRALKGRAPKASLEDRMESLKQEPGVDEVLPGDPEESSWRILEVARPDVIALGYDQTALRQSLTACQSPARLRAEIFVMQPHEPEKCHSRLISE